MSASRSLSPRVVAPKYSHFPEDLGSKLTRKYLCLFDPDKLSEPKDVVAGIFCFVQQRPKTEPSVPRQVFLALLQTYESLHAKLTQYAHLPEEEVLSAGEMLFGANGKLLAWSFQTGYFFKQLGLDKVTPELLEKVGFPQETFFSYKDWKVLSERCFKHFFNDVGRYNIIEKKANASPELVEFIKGKRAEKESELFQNLPEGKFKEVFCQIQAARDALELAVPLKQQMRRSRNISAGSHSRSDSPAESIREGANLSVDLNAIRGAVATPISPAFSDGLASVPMLETPQGSPIALYVPAEFRPEAGQVRSSPSVVAKPIPSPSPSPDSSITTIAVHPATASVPVENTLPRYSWPKVASPKPSRSGLFGSNKVAQDPSVDSAGEQALPSAMQQTDETVSCCFSLKKWFLRR